jgi:hypothetical protein
MGSEKRGIRDEDGGKRLGLFAAAGNFGKSGRRRRSWRWESTERIARSTPRGRERKRRHWYRKVRRGGWIALPSAGRNKVRVMNTGLTVGYLLRKVHGIGRACPSDIYVKRGQRLVGTAVGIPTFVRREVERKKRAKLCGRL